VNESLKNHFSRLTFAAEQSVTVEEKNIWEEEFNEFVTVARSRGCKYVLIRILSAKKIRDAPLGDRLVALEEIILDTNGFPLSMQTAGESTKNLTIFEAALAVQESLIDSTKNVFSAH